MRLRTRSTMLEHAISSGDWQRAEAALRQTVLQALGANGAAELVFVSPPRQDATNIPLLLLG